MSDSSQVALRYLAESTWNVTPAAALTNMRFTGESLDFAINNIQSEEIRSDRQVTDLVQVGANSQGDVNYEVSYAAMDDFFEAAFYSAFGAAAGFSAATVSASASDNSFNDSGSGFPALSAGQVIKVAGFTGDAANNGHFIVVSRTTSKIVVAGGTLVDDAAGETVTIDGGNMRNAATAKSFTMEKQFTDKTEFLYFKGMRVGQMTLNLAAQQIMSGTFTFLGGDSGRDTSTIGTGGPTAAPANEVLNAVSDLASLLENGSPLANTFIQSLSISINNNLRGQPAIGVLGNASVGAGRFVVTGNITVYFEDGSLYTKYVNGTPTSILWAVEDAAGQGYALYMPEVKFQTGQILAGGADQDVLASFDYQAIMDPTLGFTAQLDRFPGT